MKKFYKHNFSYSDIQIFQLKLCVKLNFYGKLCKGKN